MKVRPFKRWGHWYDHIGDRPHPGHYSQHLKRWLARWLGVDAVLARCLEDSRKLRTRIENIEQRLGGHL